VVNGGQSGGGSIEANGSVSGTITTDGATGTDLSSSDIVSYDITVSQGSTVLATLTYDTDVYNDFYFSATDQDITLNVGDDNNSQYIGIGTSSPLQYLDFAAGGYWYFESDSAYVYGDYPAEGSPIATASVPEPSTATLALFGAVGVGVHGWLRRRGAKGRRSAVS
jgi:hypothetical protein